MRLLLEIFVRETSDSRVQVARMRGKPPQGLYESENARETIGDFYTRQFSNTLRTWRSTGARIFSQRIYSSTDFFAPTTAKLPLFDLQMNNPSQHNRLAGV
jgi:hypothetical protein